MTIHVLSLSFVCLSLSVHTHTHTHIGIPLSMTFIFKIEQNEALEIRDFLQTTQEASHPSPNYLLTSFLPIHCFTHTNRPDFDSLVLECLQT